MVCKVSNVVGDKAGGKGVTSNSNGMDDKANETMEIEMEYLPHVPIVAGDLLTQRLLP